LAIGALLAVLPGARAAACLAPGLPSGLLCLAGFCEGTRDAWSDAGSTSCGRATLCAGASVRGLRARSLACSFRVSSLRFSSLPSSFLSSSFPCSLLSSCSSPSFFEDPFLGRSSCRVPCVGRLPSCLSCDSPSLPNHAQTSQSCVLAPPSIYSRTGAVTRRMLKSAWTQRMAHEGQRIVESLVQDSAAWPYTAQPTPQHLPRRTLDAPRGSRSGCTRAHSTPKDQGA
jgi:hypothetical protein